MKQSIKIALRCQGRDPDNPSNRNPGIYLEQRLEIKYNGEYIGTLTSVQKDNWILEIKKYETKDNN